MMEFSVGEPLAQDFVTCCLKNNFVDRDTTG